MKSGFGNEGFRKFFKKKKNTAVPTKKKEKKKKKFKTVPLKDLPERIRLNRYIALSGICSRREADKLIKNGVVSVNDKVVKEMGFQVHKQKDVVKVRGRKILPQPFVYILLNKPKNTITTTKDEKDRKTVMDLIKDATNLRVYPVGRLDRNTTGVLLLTNDGELAKRLTHPSYKIPKVYEVTLKEPVTKLDLENLVKGKELEDGFFKPDVVYKVPGAKNKVIVEIHSGRNRIVRRYFAALGLEIKNLDRISFAGLSKKGIRRGDWRKLEPQEIGFLKMMTGDNNKKR